MLEPPENQVSTACHEIKEWPHDINAFTEGLAYRDGFLYESAGGDETTPNIGTSSIRRIDLNNSRYLKPVSIDKRYFAEGLTIFGDRIFQILCKSKPSEVAFIFIYELQSLTKVGEVCYQGGGWGLTHDNTHFIMSDGTAELRFRDPENFTLIYSLPVTENGKALSGLNELEYANQMIYANILGQERIVRINPKSGAVIDAIDLTRLCQPFHTIGVLNGMAYDEKLHRWFITGKNWPKLFEICFK
jgi:glutamine cyclotransferase